MEFVDSNTEEKPRAATIMRKFDNSLATIKEATLSKEGTLLYIESKV